MAIGLKALVPIGLLGGAGLVALAMRPKTAAAAPGQPRPPALPLPGQPPSPPLVPGPGAPAFTPSIPADLQEAVARAIKQGTPEAISLVAHQADIQGFPELAGKLRQMASELSRAKPPPRPEQTVKPLEPKMSDALATQVTRVLRDSQDPRVLEGLASQVESLGFPAAAEQLRTKAAQVRAQLAAIEALKETERVVSPGLPPITTREPAPAPRPAPSPSPAPAPRPAPAPLPDVPTFVPPTPAPQPAPPPKSPEQILAERMARNLKSVQANFGMPGAKGKEDVSLVRRFQSQQGLGVDGKAGPGTMGALAEFVGDLPLVMYWPRSATASRVLKYRDDINQIADDAEARGDRVRAGQLRASARRERGQAGIVGRMPA